MSCSPNYFAAPRPQRRRELHLLHVYAYRAVETTSTASEVCAVGAGDKRLRRRAAGVDACPSEELRSTKATVTSESVSRPAMDQPGPATDDCVELSHGYSYYQHTNDDTPPRVLVNIRRDS